MASFVLLVVLAALLGLAVSRLWSYAVVRLAWRPRAVARMLREQGVRGPPYRFLKGSTEDIRRMKAEADGVELDVHDHDYLPRILPHFLKWKDQYGGPFVYWLGPKPRICIYDYELVKQILANKSGHFTKNDAHPTFLAIVGKGLIMVEGADWVRHRRVVNPAFAMDKLKTMTRTMVSCAECLIKKWKDEAANSKSRGIEVDLSKQFQELTADVISRTAFGSSYGEGKEAFQAQKQLQAITVATLLNVQIPGFKYLPTKRNIYKWTLEKKLQNTLSGMIQSRVASKESGFGDDLLGVMLEACFTNEQGEKQYKLILSIDEIIDECKTFFFAGHETTSHLLTWAMFLLSVYPEWQQRLRGEVLRVCGKGNPNADMLSKLTEMTMVLLETLRLYCPIIVMLRKSISDMKLGTLNLPKDNEIVIPIPMLHRDKEIWGDRANEFDPMRFENGITKAAKIPHAHLGFSIGPRSCIGQNFAMLEAKSMMAMILQKFSFTLSPRFNLFAAMASSLALALISLLVIAVSCIWEYVVVRLIWRPYAIAKRLRGQGIHGPPYKFLKGSNEEEKRLKGEAAGLVLDVHDHNHLPRIAPHYIKWRTQYGEPFVYWSGPKPRICVFDYESARQILSSKSGHFVKNDAHPIVLELMGKGLVLVDGVDWVRHRRVINPAFAMDKLKMMTQTMVSCAQSMVRELEDQASMNKNRQVEVEFVKPVQVLTADIISHTAFGSSYKLGMEAFHAQKELQAIAMASILNVQIPGFSYLPTKRNRRKWMLEKKLRSTLMHVINSRLASQGSGYGNDLLGLMLEACTATDKEGKQQKLSLSMDEIIHECKTFFFAGYETTSILLTWTVFLLSVYPEWQERLRKEVSREVGKDNPTGDNLSKFKEMTMVLLETLRLYGPALFMQRKPITDMAVGEIIIPKDYAVYIASPFMHRDKTIWGEDADEFNPLRFVNGVTRAAKVSHALLAFSIGPRACIGQNFAMLEAKSVMATILQKFSFALSPSYVHAPVDLLTLQPEFGLPVILRLLDV